MSLILDALKKSERERSKQRGPELQSIHSGAGAGEYAASEPKPARQMVLLLVALLIIIMGGWWLWPQLEQKIPADKICRVHKSYMVGLKKIESIERGRIKIANQYIPISETYKSHFFQAINNEW